MGLRKRDKKGKNAPPQPGLPPMPVPPAPGMPLPPAPGMPLPPAPGLPPMPAPTSPGLPLPTAPTAPPPQPNPPQASSPPAPSVAPSNVPDVQPQAIEALPPSPEPEPTPVEEVEDSYAGLYAKKSGKPLQQVYGHIDRIGEGEVGSLLERYSDRFGHELDRDIIVMRKEERDDKIAEIRDSPTVQLINAEEDESHLDGETLVELNNQLSTVENELRRLKPEYQAAKAEGDRELLRELRPSLEQLMAERKLIKAVIAGEADIDDLISTEDSDDEHDSGSEETYVAEESEEDVFIEFVSIIDSFLGELPESEVVAFTQSPGFEIYKVVASSPDSADDDQRSEFFSVVDTLLGGMPDDAILEFTQSEDFDVYRTVGAMYS